MQKSISVGLAFEYIFIYKHLRAVGHELNAFV